MVKKEQVYLEIKKMLAIKNYPCVAALKSFHRDDYELEIFKNMGGFHQRGDLREKLILFLNKYLETKSVYSTFWAVFSETKIGSEEQFENLLWNELSSLTSEENRNSDHDPRFSVDPQDKKFCFSIAGKAFFVVGLHPKSSRKSREFPWPALIFNVYEQFDQLIKQNLYQPMIQQNRLRDLQYQGSVNPMTEAHNDDWEAIQFSGKANPENWQCPFHFRKESASIST